MGERAEALDDAEARDEAAGGLLPPPRRINISGDLDDLLDRRPYFRTRRRGYDRLQVDNYATWVESELATSQRHCAHLMARYGACAAELERLRTAAARPQRSPRLGPVTERLGEMLRLAAEEAAAITAAGIDEAERIVAGARAEAESRLQKLELMREAALAAGEELRQERAEATGILARARQQAEAMLRAAATERDRLAAEAAERVARAEEQARRERESAAAEAAARLAAVQAEVDDLRRQRDEARESLHRLTARVGEALQAAAAASADPAASADLAALAERGERLAASAP
jgi:DNA repair exonuclease SbcCD ATPase subunit